MKTGRLAITEATWSITAKMIAQSELQPSAIILQRRWNGENSRLVSSFGYVCQALYRRDVGAVRGTLQLRERGNLDARLQCGRASAYEHPDLGAFYFMPALRVSKRL